MKIIVIIPVLFLMLFSNSIGAEKYIIQVAHNDEFFLINDEKFSAKTYCFNVNAGDKVIFVEGEPNGICTNATFYDVNTKKTCEVWCE